MVDLLKRESNAGVFLRILQNFQEHFEEHLQTAAFGLIITELVIKYWASADLFLIKNNMKWFLLRRLVDLGSG